MTVDTSYQVKIPKLPDPLPDDIYQVQVTDVTMEVTKNPFTGEDGERLTWYLHILDEGEYRGRQIMAWTANKWFVNPKTGIKSGLFAIADGVFSGYGTKIDMEFGASFNANDLIKKQVRVTVTNMDKGGGKTTLKITGYMPIKKELKPVDVEVKVFTPKTNMKQ
jgi:hypothetical protein